MANNVDFSVLQERFTSPIQAAIGGLQAGQQFSITEEAREERRAAIEAQKQQARQMQFDLAALSENPNPSAKDFSDITLKHPQLAKEFKQSFDILSEERKETTQSQVLKIFSALNAGENDIARQMVEEIKQGAANAGLTEEEKNAETFLKIMETSPEAAKTTAALQLASTMGPAAFSNTFKQITAPSAAFAAIDPGKFTQASIKAFEKSGSFADLVPSKESLQTVVTGKDKINAEKDLRKEFTALSKPFRDVRDSFARVEVSAKNPSPAGDLALIFNFMKMLDPGSVVRESEFANAATAQEFMERKGLSFDAVKRVWEGERLSEKARNDFVGRARQLMDRQQAQHKQREGTFKDIAKGNGLTVTNIVIPLEDPLTEQVEEPEAQLAPPNIGRFKVEVIG
jgi:hypothetical protein